MSVPSARPARQRLHTISTAQAAVRVSDSGGHGFPLLMIHGSGYSRRVFQRQFDAPIARYARLIALDLPGHGDSQNAPDPASTYTVTGLADCVATVIQKLGLSRVAVFGWSLGGHVAIELMQRDASVAGLMLSGAPPIPRGVLGMLRGFHLSRDLLLASREVLSPPEIERFARLCFGDDPDPSFLELVARSDGRLRGIFARSLSAGVSADQRAAVESARVPIAFVNGADDPFVRVSYFAGVPARTLVSGGPKIIAGAGHAPFWQQAERFNVLLARFVEAVASSEATRQANSRDALAG